MKSSSKKTGPRKRSRKATPPIWGSKSKKVRMFLATDSDEFMKIILFIGKFSGTFEFNKKAIDFNFSISTCEPSHWGMIRSIEYRKYPEITKNQLKEITRPINISNLEGEMKKKAIELAQTWDYFEEFFSI